jgi:hypothetical protein
MIPYLKIFIFIFIVIVAIIPTLLFANLISVCPIKIIDDHSQLLVGIELLLIIAFIIITISVRV